VWMQEPPQAIPPTVPVTVLAGTPVVNMPGCVKVHKENVKQRSKNKMLVNDDPKGNTVLCDAGAPYYEPAEYDYRGLTWQTVYSDSEEVPEGVDTGDPPTPEIPDAPRPPETPGETAGEVECPPPNARRIGDLNQAGTEKVVGYELTPDGKICETQWEAIGFAEQYLPSVPVVSTTATIDKEGRDQGKNDTGEERTCSFCSRTSVCSEGSEPGNSDSEEGCKEVELFHCGCGIWCSCGIIFPPGAVTTTSAHTL
jgi:hypothetical protein